MWPGEGAAVVCRVEALADAGGGADCCGDAPAVQLSSLVDSVVAVAK